MKVKLLTARSGEDGSHAAGEVIDLPKHEAEAYVAAGMAEAVESDQPKAKKK